MSRTNTSHLLHAGLIAFCVVATAMFFIERHRTQEEAQQFRMSVQGAGAGQWYWDIDANELRWDEQMFELFSVSKVGWKQERQGIWVWQGGAKASPAEAFQNALYGPDRSLIAAILQRAVMLQASYQAIFRVPTQAGGVTTIRAGGQVYGGGRYMTGLCIKAQPDDQPENVTTRLIDQDSAWGVVEPASGG